MKSETVHVITYSPTRTSYKVAKEVAEAVGGATVQKTDLTYADGAVALTCKPEDVAVLAVPVYAGRVAPIAAKRLAGIKGQATPAVVVVVYGNREYEDALLELRNLATEAGFVVVAAAAFIGEHSFSSVDMPVAPGRPDQEDLQKARDFGTEVAAAIARLANAGETSLAGIPGNFPYKDGVGPMPFGPQLDDDLCTLCGSCVDQCPVGAITVAQEMQLDVALCTLCCRCIKVCPEEALSIAGTPAKAKMEWLFANCKERKEPVVFLPAAP